MGVLQDKVAIITGAVAVGGMNMCAALAREGARVAIVDVDEFAAMALAADLETAGGQAIAVACDTRDGDDITKAVQTIVDWFGTVDILVNNIDSSVRDVALEDMTDTDFELALASSTATLRFMRACHPYLVGGGQVINLSNGAEVISVAQSAAREWKWHGITVSCQPRDHEDALTKLFIPAPPPRNAGANTDIGPVAVFPVASGRSFSSHALAG